MAATGTTSVDTMLADAIAKLDGLTKRMDALEVGGGSKNPIKGDDDDDKKDDAAAKADAKRGDDDDDKKDDAASKKDAAKDDDGELEVKSKEKKEDSKKSDAVKTDAKKADDDDDKKADDDDDKKADAKAKADAEEEEKKKKEDAAKADSVADLRKQIADQSSVIRRLEALMTPKTDDEHAAFADAQSKADAVFNGFGQRAPRPLEGETLINYRKRLATKLKPHSAVWKDVKKLSGLPDEAFDIAEAQIYSDATAAASTPADLQAGELRAVTKIDPATGVRSTVFYGTESFVKSMGRPGRKVASFRTFASQ